MKKLTRSAAAKTGAAILLFITLIITIAGCAVIVFTSYCGFYSVTASGGTQIKANLAYNHMDSSALEVYYNYFQDFERFRLRESGFDDEMSDYIQRLHDSFSLSYSRENSNFFFTIKNSDGDTVLSNYYDSNYLSSRTFTLFERYSLNDGYEIAFEGPVDGAVTAENYPFTTAITDYSAEMNLREEYYVMDCYVRSDTSQASDWYSDMSAMVDSLFPVKYPIIALTVVSFIAAAVLAVFLMMSAGHTKKSDVIVVGGIHRLPFDLMLVITVVVFLVCLVMLCEVLNDISYYASSFRIVLWLSFVLLSAAGAYTALITTAMSLAVRIKGRCLIRNTVLYRLSSRIGTVCSKTWSGTKYILAHLPLMWKVVLGILALSFVEFIAIGTLSYTYDFFIFWFFEKLILIPLLLMTTVALCRLRDGAKIIAGGNLDFKINTRYMYLDFKQHAEDLNHISEGMSMAVEERIKSEHLKTELITNVSHDIKTPLTSIINYVDLLKKEKLDNETANEYLEVLDRQSARLKKLIEDLVDASRFSTGNISVNLELTSVNILIDQIVGEYEERLGKNNLKLVINKPDDDIYITADGCHMWRVMDNLMTNICKYAMPSSRVYISLTRKNGDVILTFRNISRDELNISSDELMERFVRGDKSRNTDGSGLGLSIARSLISLQGGAFDISIDGDLFKATVIFREAFPDK